MEGITSELAGLLTQFIIKYCRNTGLDIEEVHHSISYLNDEIQEFSSVTIMNNCQRQPLIKLDDQNVSEISNPEYYKLKDCLLKCYKSSVKENNNRHISSSSKICSYCLEKGHNIRSCAKNKASNV